MFQILSIVKVKNVFEGVEVAHLYILGMDVD